MGSNDSYGGTLVTVTANVVEVATMKGCVAAGGPFYRHLWSPSQRQVCLEVGSF